MKRGEAAQASADSSGAPPAKRAPEHTEEERKETEKKREEETAVTTSSSPPPPSSADQQADSSSAAGDIEQKRGTLVQKIVEIQKDERRITKATTVLSRALQEELSAETAATFRPALHALLETRPLPALKGSDISRGYADVFAVVLKRLESAYSPVERFEARNWALRGAVHRDLMTDDSFRFAAACKNVQLALEEMDTACRSNAQTDQDAARATAPQASAELRRDRSQCIAEMLQTLLGMYGRLWARPSVEHIFKLAKERRMLFDEANRERLDEKTNALRQRQAQTTLGAKRTADRNYGPLSG